MPIPIIYLWMYKKLREENSQLLTVRTVNEVLKRCALHQIPKPLHIQIIKEMERYGLVEKINNRRGYRVLENKEYKKIRGFI